jgi:signal transduction histidine kinase
MLTKWLRSSTSRPMTRRLAVEDLARSLALIVDPDTLRASIAGRVRELVGCDSVIFCRVRPEETAFVDVYSTSATEMPRVRFATAGSLAKWLRVNEEPFVIPHPEGAFEYLDQAERASLTRLHVRACVPVVYGRRAIGILLICAVDPSWRLTPDDLELLGAIGRQAGLALENAELQHLQRERLRNLHHAEQLAVAGQLAATVAHEIRNPLAAIRSSVQYVVQGTAEWATKQEMLEQVLNEVDRIERTLSGVLALSRPHELELSEMDLVESVEQSLLLIQAYAQAHRIMVEREFEAERLPVMGDARELHQVCLNLFLNACQAMPDGGHLTLRCAVAAPDAEAKPLALLQVRDTGSGISAADLARIFDPFFTTKRTGTGLGLPICLEIITRHDGQLRVESEPGRGTAATVLLPLRVT